MPLYSTNSTSAHLDYRLIVAISLLLSMWLIAIDPIINRDGIIYLRAAETYLQDGFLASQQTFGRPFISLCIAVVHQLTGVSLLHAGLALSSLLYALLCTSFVATIHTLGGDRRVQLLGAIVILSHPMLNASRSSIMRDPAYWSFLLLAFRELVLYARNPVFRHQFRWYTYLLVAVLFRFEALFFAALAPLVLAGATDPGQRLRNTMKLLVPQLLTMGVIFAAIWLYQNAISPGALLFPDITRYIDNFLSFPSQFKELAATTAQTMLEFTARDDASIAVLFGLAGILILNICRALTWPYVAVLYWGWWSRADRRINDQDAVLLRGHLLICLIYLSAFLLINRFMLERYSSALVVFASLYLPFILHAIWQREHSRWAKYIVGILLAGMMADTLHNSDYEKYFIQDANEWVLANTPEDALLVSNDRYIAYFSRRDIRWDRPDHYKFNIAQLSRNPQFWRGRDYLVAAVKRREKDQWEKFLKDHALQEVALFEGGRNGIISVIKLEPTTANNSADGSYRTDSP